MQHRAIQFALPVTLMVALFALTPAQLCAQSYLINTVYQPPAGHTLSALAVDAAGDIFVGSVNPSGVGEVLRISPSGTVLVVAGGGSSPAFTNGVTATSVSFYNIYSLAVDPAGTTLYIVAAAGPSLNNTALLYVVNTQGLIQSVPNFGDKSLDTPALE